MSDHFHMELTFPDRADWILSQILSVRAKQFVDKTFITQPGGSTYSYAQTDAIASGISQGLIDRGLRPGDRLLIYLDNCPEYVIAWFGAARANVVEVPINTEYFGSMLQHCVTMSEPRGIVVGSRYVDRFIQIADSLRTHKILFFVYGEDDNDAIRMLSDNGLSAEPLEHLLAIKPVSPPPRHARQDLAAILFTSGTTGPSKGVMMSHAQTYFFSDQCVNLVKLTSDDVYMTSNTLFHANAQFLTIYPALIAGASVVLYEKFSSSLFSQRLAESGATVTNFLGVMMDWIAKQPPADTDAKSKLRCIFSVPTAWSGVDLLKQRFGVEAFVEAFGQTEICLPMLTPYGQSRPVGAVGLAVSDWFDIRLANPETDEEVKPGQVGELQIRPREPWIVNSGYFNMPEATAAARRNLWLHTGDGLKQDRDGWYYFVDRFKDCLRRRGENVSSYDVESPILLHPRVASCAAVGVPATEDGGEDEIAVFIVPAGGETITPNEIIAWMEKKVPPFLIPRFVQILDRFPLTPSGKTQKVELRRMGVQNAWDRQARAVREIR
jgi:carnitine-CoA ligase